MKNKIYYGVIWAAKASAFGVSSTFTEIIGRHPDYETAQASFYEFALKRYPKTQGYTDHTASASEFPESWLAEAASDSSPAEQDEPIAPTTEHVPTPD